MYVVNLSSSSDRNIYTKLMKIILSPIYRKVLFVIRLFNQKQRILRLFYAGNFKRLRKVRIQVGNNLKVNQRVLLTGQGSIIIGNNVTLGFVPGGFTKGAGIELQPRAQKAVISIGNNVATNNNIFICSCGMITIKDNVLLGQNITIMDFEAHGIPPDKRREVGEISRVLIEENVWVGNNVTILKGSRIGKNSIIATHAVVSGEFPDNVIIGGVPAKVIKKLN